MKKMILIALAAMMAATTGCAKPGCSYSDRISTISERSQLNQFEYAKQDQEYRARCGLNPRRAVHRRNPGMVCASIGGRTICRAR